MGDLANLPNFAAAPTAYTHTDFNAIFAALTLANGAVTTNKLADGAVTSAKVPDAGLPFVKLATLAANTLMGNNTGGAAAATALTVAQVKALLGLTQNDILALTTSDEPLFKGARLTNATAGGDKCNLLMTGGDTAGGGPYVTFKRGGTIQGHLGTSSALLGDNSNDLMLYGIGSNSIKLVNVTGGVLAEFRTSGLNACAIGTDTAAPGKFTTLAASDELNLTTNTKGIALKSFSDVGNQPKIYAGADNTLIFRGASGGTKFANRADNTVLMALTDGGALSVLGNVTAPAFVPTSSRRTKKNIRTLKLPANVLLALRAVRYDERRKGGNKRMVGFIAEEIAKQFPALVPKDERGRAIGVNYAPLVSVAIAAAQDHERRLKKLERRAA